MASGALCLLLARSASADETATTESALPELPALPPPTPTPVEPAPSEEVAEETDEDEVAPEAIAIDAADYDTPNDAEDALGLVTVKQNRAAAPGHGARRHAPKRPRAPRTAKKRHPHRPPTARVPHARPHPPRFPHPPKPPRPQAFDKTRMFFFKEDIHRAPPMRPPPPYPNHDHGEHRDDAGARGGIAVSASGTRVFGMPPIGDAMLGARAHVAVPLPTLSQGARWLSTGTIGLKGGVDLQTASASTAQLWHVGVAFGMGAPWSRDVVGVSIEGGILGGRYHDSNGVAYAMSENRFVPGPYAENIGPNAYGAASLTLQLPLRGNVRPFVAGDFGITSRDDGKVTTLPGGRGGLVWNAW